MCVDVGWWYPTKQKQNKQAYGKKYWLKSKQIKHEAHCNIFNYAWKEEAVLLDDDLKF